MNNEKVIEKARQFVNDRRVIDGPVNDLMMVSPLKHQFADAILEKMMENTWSHHEVDMSEDAKQFGSNMILSTERDVYTDAIAFLSNLDGIQVNNLTKNISRFITSPEIPLAMTRQAWEEALHVKAYSHMIETLPGLDPIEVYNRFQTDPVLAKKNKYIMRASNKVREEYSPHNFSLAVISNVALEGIYFYSGFLVFYTLARMGKMKESAKMIRFIQRDEMTHLDLFVNIHEAMKRERPELYTDEWVKEARKILRDACKLEMTWAKHIIRHGVMGLSDAIVEGFIMDLGNKRSVTLGMGEIYPGNKNTVPWFDEFAAISKSEESFFEAKVSAYENNGALVW